MRAEVLAPGIVDLHLHARGDQRLRHLSLVDPAFAAILVDHLEPVGAPLLDLHLFAALDDVHDREGAAGAGAHFEKGIGNRDLEAFCQGRRRRRQKDQQPAGREPRHRFS